MRVNLPWAILITIKAERPLEYWEGVFKVLKQKGWYFISFGKKSTALDVKCVSE